MGEQVLIENLLSQKYSWEFEEKGFECQNSTLKIAKMHSKYIICFIDTHVNFALQSDILP